MVALRLTYTTDSAAPLALAGEGNTFASEYVSRERSVNRRGLLLEATPVDAYRTHRIDPAFDLRVEEMSHKGLEGRTSRAMGVGRVVSISFPSSPFLPAPGTLARVTACVPAGKGYRLNLEYRAHPAA